MCVPAGKQAEVLNILVDDVMQGHPVSEQRLKEVLGHNPLEVDDLLSWQLQSHMWAWFRMLCTHQGFDWDRPEVGS
jgi:hypothetical protein